jgi:predicted metal-binding membrane protein
VRPEPEAAGTAGAARATVERRFSPTGAIVAAALAAAAALAWWWLIGAGRVMAGAGAAMPAMPAANVWTAAYLGAAFMMWALMMVAMMLPSASPMILLYERFVRRSGAGHALASSAAFALAYIGIWTLFSAGAAIGQAALISSGIVSEMALRIGNGRIAGALLVFAGLYQLSPLKRACLEECRSPLSFLMRLWRPGVAGAVRIGLAHGLYCLGCCWALMLLLFAGGVMSIAWIAALGALVFLEKLAPLSLRMSKVIAVILLAAGTLPILGVSNPLWH